MEEEEALINFCRRVIPQVRSKLQHLESSEEQRRRHRGRTEGERRAVLAGDEFRDGSREKHQTSHSLMCQGPEVQPVPPQLMSMLRLKTFKEDMRRAAEAELHHPAVCCPCEQQQASLALKSFIRRKTTQLHFQTLQDRLNTHSSQREYARWLGGL